MGSYTVDHLTVIVPGWGKVANLFDDLDSGGWLALVSPSLVTTPTIPSTEAEMLAAYNFDPLDHTHDFYPDGDMWYSIMGGDIVEADSADTEGFWSVE